MDQFMLLSVLVALLVIIILFFLMMYLQTRKNNEIISFLADRYKAGSDTQNEAHQKQIEAVLNMNLYQAERHQKQVDSLLGLIDELAARANPDKISAQQYHAYQQYLIEQAKNAK